MIGSVRSLAALASGVALSAVLAAPAVAEVQYASCAEARAADAAPMRVGAPGYRLGLDRDRDGIACEDGGDENPAPIEKPVCPDLPPSRPTPVPTDDGHIPTVPDPQTPPPAEDGADDPADQGGQDGDRPHGDVVEDDQAEDVVSDNPVRFRLAETPQPACPSTTAKPVGDSDQVGGGDNAAVGGQDADGDSLPVTGAPVQLAVFAGLVLLIAGVGALVMARRRTRFTA